MAKHDSAMVYEALLAAQRAVSRVEANETAEVLSASGRPRDIPYASAEAVTAAARVALTGAGLLLLLREVGAPVQGITGPELPLTFELVHIDSSETIVREMRWALADAADFLGRPQAQAATIATARKHLQMDLLAIEVIRRRAGVTEPAPDWMGLDARSTVAPAPAPAEEAAVHREPPADVEAALMVWQKTEYSRRVEVERASGGTGGAAVYPGWPDAVAAALGGTPRPARGARALDSVCGFLRVHAQAAAAAVAKGAA